MMIRGVFVAVAVLAAAAVVSAHSYLDCSRWIPNDPQAYTDPSKRRFADADGTCEGYARRYEVGIKPFGKMDEIQFYRHYIQGSNPNSCRRNNGGTSADGSNEGPATPRSGAYAPNKDVYSKTFGKMAQVHSGDTLCWRWPAKNHMAHVTSSNMVHVNWDDVPNRATELSQSELRTKRIASLQFNNCPVPGVPSPGDQTGVGSELRPCGGCFTVPSRAPGIYTVQWDWPFKAGDSETYTSCADIEVLASPGGATNCAVSGWSNYGACSTNCGGGTMTRTRTITTAASGGGTACPALTESMACNTATCSSTSNYLSEHVVYDDALRGFEDWSWSTSYSLAATSPVKVGSSSISFTPKSWEAVYLNYPTGGDISAYQGISFWVHGGATGGQSIYFAVVITGASQSTPLFQWTVPTSKIVANQWTQVNLTFASLGKTSGVFDGLWFQAIGEAAQATMYFDEIYFMHVHQGGSVPAPTDPCAGITCGTNSQCVGGSCTCTGGYGKTAAGACTIAPTVTSVAVKTLAGTAVTTLTGGETLDISWSYTGSLSTVSIVLESSVSSIPDQIAKDITNSGKYTWMVPSGLAPATYTVRVFWSSSVLGRTSGLTKSTAAVPNTCASPDCSGHGECDDDTNYVCVCRYGFTGSSCSTAPSGIVRLTGSLKVSTPYSEVVANPMKFASIFRSDIAAALVVLTDQIEPTAYSASGTGTQVSFDVLFGGQFRNSPLSLTTNAGLTAVLDTQLSTSDSSLNRGTNTYSAATALTGSATASASASTMVVAAATVLAAAALL